MRNEVVEELIAERERERLLELEFARLRVGSLRERRSKTSSR
jgi:hypothetical protein